MKFLEAVRSLDWVAVGAALLLVLIGLSMIFSSTFPQGALSGLFVRQAVAFLIALGAFVLLATTPYHSLRRWAVVIYCIGIAALVLVTLVGPIIRGATSRLTLLGVQIQPSEFMRAAIVIVLAWLLARWRAVTGKSLLLSVLIVGLPVVLILFEPDIGMASLLIILWATLLIFFGLSWRALVPLALLGAVILVIAWQWLLVDYQKARLLTFLNPQHDPLGAGYNITQSIVALGSGQLLGRGLGHGPQSRLKFLPEQHTDFILSSIGEELGYVGVLIVIGLYVVLLWRILLVARQTSDVFGQLLCVGTFIVLLTSLFVSAGMNMGLLPVTGIPLPLVSYGGSNLVSTFLLLGVVQSVRLYSKWARVAPPAISHIT